MGVVRTTRAALPAMYKRGGQTAEQLRTATAGTAATGRFTTPQHVADLVVFLASDRSGNISGSDLRIDGGFVSTLSGTRPVIPFVHDGLRS
jgi:NAD(P)-dependent dehydrogenase (short-subunit alcohol dehydrogenase family)